MPRELLAPALALLVLTAGCSALSGTAAEVTVENEDSTAYTMTVYVIDESVGAGNVTFRATNETGSRKTIEAVRLETEGPYYDVTLADGWDATAYERQIPANGTTTASFEAWESSDHVVYLFETPDGRLVRDDYAECRRDTIEHTFVFSDGPENGMEMDCR